jgi:bifunctional non-homologous end joining protein LigD
VRTPAWYPGDGDIVRAASRSHGLEGVVGKPLASRYQPGRRRDWVKIKNTRHQELLICGWTPGTGRPADMIGSLVLGGYDGARLRYAGTGITHAMRADLIRLLATRAGTRRMTTRRYVTEIPCQST